MFQAKFAHHQERETEIFTAYGILQRWIYRKLCTVKPVLNGISRDQNIFPLKPGFRLIKVHYLYKN